ncbi:MAG TPA: helical backbone metal receptor [Niabella sp.]
MRIISLVPSITELLFTLGLEEDVIGITKFCIHPDQWFRTKTRVGGTKTIHIEKVIALRPDLIIANKEENTREQVEELSAVCNVLLTDVSNLEEALDMIRTVGYQTQRPEQADELIFRIRQEFSLLHLQTDYSVVYLIWKDPWMTVGGDTFINDLLSKAGFNNLFRSHFRYPTVDPDALLTLAPQKILLSSEPFPFREKHAQQLKPLFPHSEIVLVDGELFSWYGSRLLKAPAYFRQLHAGFH